MATAAVKRRQLEIGPDDNGALLTPEEFDQADFEQGWRYELIHGVLVVSPIPAEGEADPNEELGHWLRSYQESHPQGKSLDKTLPERHVKSRGNRRKADRLIWCGLGRPPKKGESPTIAVEFVSKGKRNRQRDYEEKRIEYEETGLQEYWIIDRFERIMTVYQFSAGRVKKRIIRENQVYTTKLLPGFELPLAKLLALADEWDE